MGAGIAQVCVATGYPVRLHDADPTALVRATARIEDGLDRWHQKGRLDAEAHERARSALAQASSIDEAVADATLIIEATVEDADVKDAVFRAVDAAAPPGADPRHEHELALRRRASRGHASTGERPRPALLQSRAAHGARRARDDLAHERPRRRSSGGLRADPRQDPAALRRYARLHRQPRRAAIRRRGGPDRRGRGGHRRRRGRGAGSGRLSDGSVPPARPHRPRRGPRDRRATDRGLRRCDPLRATLAPAAARRGRTPRAQDRDRLLRIPR